MPEPQKLLLVEGITKQYEVPGGGQPLTILNDVHLQLERGESAAILGPSGSGKTTLLNILGTLDEATSGSVQLDGVELTTLAGTRVDTVRNRDIGFVFQSHHLLPQCTVLENVLVPSLADGSAHPPKEVLQSALSLLARVGLTERLYFRPGLLSGGERQRVAVVRALINRPKLLLADEPTGSLDRKSANSLTDLLLELVAEYRVGLLVVTHSAEMAARMQRRYELVDGRLVASE